MLVFYQKYDLQFFSPSLWLLFWFTQCVFWSAKAFSFDEVYFIDCLLLKLGSKGSLLNLKPWRLSLMCFPKCLRVCSYTFHLFWVTFGVLEKARVEIHRFCMWIYPSSQYRFWNTNLLSLNCSNITIESQLIQKVRTYFWTPIIFHSVFLATWTLDCPDHDCFLVCFKIGKISHPPFWFFLFW